MLYAHIVRYDVTNVQYKVLVMQVYSLKFTLHNLKTYSQIKIMNKKARSEIASLFKTIFVVRIPIYTFFFCILRTIFKISKITLLYTEKMLNDIVVLFPYWLFMDRKQYSKRIFFSLSHIYIHITIKCPLFLCNNNKVKRSGRNCPFLQDFVFFFFFAFTLSALYIYIYFRTVYVVDVNYYRNQKKRKRKIQKKKKKSTYRQLNIFRIHTDGQKGSTSCDSLKAVKLIFPIVANQSRFQCHTS